MKARLKKAKGPNTHSTWWCYIVAVLLILIYLLPIYIMLNLSFRTIQDVGSKLSLPAMWNFQNYIDVFKSGDLWLGFKNSIHEHRSGNRFFRACSLRSCEKQR